MRKSATLPEYLEIPVKVMDTELCIVLGTKDITVPVKPNKKFKKALSKLTAKGYKAMFPTLTKYTEYEIINVAIAFRKPKNLTRSKTSVKNGKCNKLRTFNVGSARYKTDESGNVFTA